MMNESTKIREVNETINKIKIGNAPGPDGCINVLKMN